MQVIWVLFVYVVSFFLVAPLMIVATVVMINPHSDMIPNSMQGLVIPLALLITFGVPYLIANKAWKLSENWPESDEPQSRR